MRKTYFDFV